MKHFGYRDQKYCSYQAIIRYLISPFSLFSSSPAYPQVAVELRSADHPTAPGAQDAGATGEPMGPGGLRRVLQARDRRKPAHS